MSKEDTGRSKVAFPSTRQTWKVAGASLIGTTVEYYDFMIFSTAAALVFPKVFFPESSPSAGTLAAFATFGVGFVARPLGGLVFSHFGDRVGRKAVLIFTLVLMGIGTVGIGVLPTYAGVGILAPALLVTLRIIQGIAVGGEWGGAILIAFEHAPGGRRGFFGSIPQVGTVSGALLGSLVFLLVGLLPEAALLSWGWRIPFLVGGLIIVVGLILRLSIAESQEFSAVKQSGQTPRLPIVELLRSHTRQVALVIGTVVGIGFGSFTFTTYLLNYATSNLGVPSSDILLAIVITNVVQLVAIPVAGSMSDRYGRFPVFLLGFAALGIGSLLAPSMLASATFVLILLLYVLAFGVGISFLIGGVPALAAESFPTPVRYAGTSLGYQLAQPVAGFAPFVLVLLHDAAGSVYVVSLALIVLATLSGVCAWRLDAGNRAVRSEYQREGSGVSQTV